MARKLFITTVLFLIVFLVMPSVAQNTVQPKTQIRESGTLYLPEKVYLHLDKTDYTIGDEVWFKAYVVSSENLPTNTSGVLYVDLIEENVGLHKQLKLALQSGVCWGMFKTADLKPNGSYRLRAYTRWMRNDKSSFFFNLPLLPHKKIEEKVTESLEFSFYPESGKLLDGIPQKVVVKASHHVANAKGSVIDQNKNEIATFQITDGRLSHFYLTAKSGEVYSSQLVLSNGQTKTFTLPEVVSSGVQISVRDIDTARISMRIHLSPDLIGTEELSMDLKRNGEVILSNKLASNKPAALLNLPIGSIPSGIVILTINSPKHGILCERPVFVDNPKNVLSINIDELKATYKPSEEMSIPLFSHQGNVASQGSLSISINYNDKTFSTENSPNIFNNLLLSSDLDVNENQKIGLTDDWKKNDEIVLSNVTRKHNPNLDIKYKAEKGLEISGKVEQDKKAAKKVPLSLYSITAPFITMDTVTNDDGRFSFSLPHFLDATQFAIKAKGQYIISLDTVDNIADIEAYQSLKNIVSPTDTTTKQAIIPKAQTPSFATKTNTLKQVEIVGSVNKASPRSSNMNGPGMADHIFNAEDMEKSMSLPHFIDIHVPSLQRVGQDTSELKYYLRRNVSSLDEGGMLSSPSPVKIMLDGVETSAENITNVSIDDIESLEVLKSAAYSAIYGASGGLIIVTTKRGDRNKKNQHSTAGGRPLLFTSQGFSAIPDFGKKENNPIQKNTSKTIFWNPNIITDKEGKAVIKYTNLTVPGFYKITIEGINADGNLGRKVLTYEVK